MDKILSILEKANLSEDDLKTIKSVFESVVAERVAEESKVISEQADLFCKQKIESAVKLKTAHLEEMSAQYCEKKIATIAKKADKKIADLTEQLQKFSEQYIVEYFDEKFQEKYGQELEIMEEKVITDIDKYLEYAVSEKISPKLIEKTAINETFAPIVKGIQSLFEEQYVPLNVSGSKKLKEAKIQMMKLESTLKEQINDNMRLAEAAETASKQALIAEKTASLSEAQKSKVKRFFESKSYAAVKTDIDDYCQTLLEQAPVMRIHSNDHIISEQRKMKPKAKTSALEDGTTEFIKERFKPENNRDDVDDFLLKTVKYLK